MKGKAFAHYGFVALVVIVLALALYVLSPFATAIIFGILLAYIAHPVYRAMNDWVKRPNVSAIIVTVLVALLLMLPVGLMGQRLAGDLNDIYVQSRDRLQQDDVLSFNCDEEYTTVCRGLDVVTSYIDQDQLRQYLSQGVTLFLNFLAQSLRTLLLSIPAFVLNVVIMLFVMFYAVRDGQEWVRSLKDTLPIAKRHSDKLFSYTNETLYAMLYGQIITSIVQGLLGGIGFWIFGVSNPIFWGLIMAFLSVIPFIGAWLIWIPAAIGLFVAGEPGSAIGLTIYSLIFVSLSDNVLRPYVVSGKADIHPLVVFLGVFGGLAVFGLAGFILGPLVVALAIVLAKAYHQELIA